MCIFMKPPWESLSLSLSPNAIENERNEQERTGLVEKNNLKEKAGAELPRD
jgi:hypothetical protein